MSSLWSKTSTAVNTGYGMDFGRIGMPNPFYKPQPMVHPELLMEPPYAEKEPLLRNRHRTVGGGSLVKGSEEAKKRMAYLRSLRKKKKGGMRICGKKHIRGGDSMVGEILGNLGTGAKEALTNLALETGVSIGELLSNPRDLIATLAVYAPSAVKSVKNFFGIGKKDDSDDEDEEEEEEEDMATRRRRLRQKQMMKEKKILQYLKYNQPEAYKKEVQRLKQARIDALTKKLNQYYGIVDEIPSSSSSSSSSPSSNPAPSGIWF